MEVSRVGTSITDYSSAALSAGRHSGLFSAYFDLQPAEDGRGDAAQQAGDPLLQEEERRRGGGQLRDDGGHLDRGHRLHGHGR